MVLQPDVTRAGEILQRSRELIARSVRVLTRFRPAIQVHLQNLLAVQFHADLCTATGYTALIPLPGGTIRVLGWRAAIVDGPGGTAAAGACPWELATCISIPV